MTISGVAKNSTGLVNPPAGISGRIRSGGGAILRSSCRPTIGSDGRQAIQWKRSLSIALLSQLLLGALAGVTALRADEKSDRPSDPPASAADDFARDFYNSYLDSLSDPRVQRKELLESNLVRSLQRILPGSDPLGGGAAYAEKLQAKDLTYARVDRTNPFVRGILKELPHLKVEPFMFIVRSGPYIVFLCYRADPFRYRVKETDDFHVVRRKEATPADTGAEKPSNPPSSRPADGPGQPAQNPDRMHPQPGQKGPG